MKKKWYQSIGNWVVILLFVVLGPVLLLNLFIIFQAKTNEDEIPSILGYKPFMVLSGSMESEIRKGDLILTKEIDPEDLMLHDVIAFRDAQNTVTTHRIIDIVEKSGVPYFITKGDNNSTQDLNLVSYQDIEGIYVGRIPGIGSIMETLSKPTTILIGIGVITAIFVITFTISSNKQREEMQKEFLEYKRMKELEEQKEKMDKKTKEMKSIKASSKKEVGLTKSTKGSKKSKSKDKA